MFFNRSMRSARRSASVLLIALLIAQLIAMPSVAVLTLTEVDINTGVIELTNIGTTAVSGSTLEFCVPFVYGVLESGFTFNPGESRTYDMSAINPMLNLAASDDLWIYQDRVGGFGNTQFVTSGVVWGSNQSGAGRVNSVVTNTAGAAWADASDFVDTSALGIGQTLQLNFPGDVANASSGWSIADADFGNFGGLTCAQTWDDADGDGDIDGAEFDALSAQISSGTFDACFDANLDGIHDITDMDELRAVAGAQNLVSGNPYLPGDANLDGNVDGLDFIAWNDNKFTPSSEWTGGDFNVDGNIDGLDFIVWNSFKFQASDAVVPEPSAALIALFGAAIMYLRRRH